MSGTQIAIYSMFGCVLIYDIILAVLKLPTVSREMRGFFYHDPVSAILIGVVLGHMMIKYISNPVSDLLIRNKIYQIIAVVIYVGLFIGWTQVMVHTDLHFSRGFFDLMRSNPVICLFIGMLAGWILWGF